MPDAHKYGARDVDYNPNKPFYVVTSGEDRLVKFWDIRKPDRPMKVLLGHSHWAWTVAFNRFHDQLILSGGTDSLVNLWRVSSISSAPLLELEGHNRCERGVAAHSSPPPPTNEHSLLFAGALSPKHPKAKPHKGPNPCMYGTAIERFNEWYLMVALSPLFCFSLTVAGCGPSWAQTARCFSKPDADVRVRAFDEHEESVYSVAWSACDAWVFVSLSYDGRVVLNHVPSTEKYKILL